LATIGVDVGYVQAGRPYVTSHQHQGWSEGVKRLPMIVHAKRRKISVWGVSAAVAALTILGGALSVSHNQSSPPLAAADPLGWFRVSDHGLSFAVPPGTLINPKTCLVNGVAYVLTTNHSCKPAADGPGQSAPVVIWMRPGPIASRQRPRPSGPEGGVPRTIGGSGLSGFVIPMSDPGFMPQTQGSTYTWLIVEAKSNVEIDLFGNQESVADKVIASLQRDL